ncbi:OmpA family protein [Leptospira sp. 85282-16]|uniref:OmpA family protein n=1 Tax=Leptospira sp. 85282-16 TaxID=2971256 RepID=UPI0021BE12B8|nr:OmpA family protein [Leptospira sp. 85282-16]MCT8333915.1 OmpA family protein [Leptospira sp. 85282-16]
MADSYYRTISGKQYDNELLEIAEKATKRSKAPIGKNIAKTLFDAIKDGGDYTDVEKRTVKYIRDNFKFSAEADEYLRSEIRKWAAKISVPAAKKKSSTKASAKKESTTKRSSARAVKASDEGFTPYTESYEFGETSHDEIAPTPEYNELVALNKFQITPKQNRLGRIILLSLIFVFFIVLIIFGIRSCNRSSKSSDNINQESNVSPEPTGTRSLERVELSQGKISNRFESRASAIRYINDLQIRFIKQSMQTEDSASDKIATLAEALKAYPGVRIRIKGHTCFIGEMDENKILSDERAKFIFDELVKNGVSATQLDYRGFGETAEIESNSTEAGRIKNRRVDFTVLSVNE